ncbi:MAG: class I SAM-dependent methyltransferase [Betaproteobacteria bacterium]
MPAPETVSIGTLIAILVVAIIWRLASRRQSLPCPSWLRWMVELDNPFTETNRAAFIVEHLALEPGMSVLDAGCGPGRLTLPLAQKVGITGHVLAMDIQTGMLERTKSKVEAAGLGQVEFLHAGLGDGRLPRERFDCAVLVTVLGEIPDQDKALREIFEALRPGGLLSITEVIFDPHFQRRSVVTRLVRAVGFKEKAFFGNKIAYVLHLEKPH